MVSAVLALSMVSSIASSSWADTGSGEDQYGSDFKLLLNTSEADNTGSWSLNYGQDISFDVSGTGITSGAVKSYYYVASGEDKLAAFTTDTTLKCGTYNLSYTVDDTTGSTNEYYDSTGNQTYTLTVKQATLMTPSDAVWTNGSAASWSAVTKTTDSADIDAGTELSYSVKLYKDGVEADTETTTSTTFDFTDKIITLGKGAYTFTVSATPTTNTDLYLGSGSSAASASTTAVDVSFVKGNGVTSIDNTSNALMITGNSTYNNIASRTAAIATGFTSAAWSVSSAYLTVTPSGTGNTGVSVSFNGNAITSTTATVNVVGNETDVPTITNLSCNSNNVTATLSDSGSGVAAYAFSQSDSSDGVTWETPETVVGSTDKTFSLTATGTWYVWVKDVCGNVTRSDAINVGSVTYHNYYDQGTSSLADKVVYYSFTGASKTLTSLETTARPGFTSSGWFTDSALTGTAATSVTLTTAAPSCEVWHKWTLTDATWTTVPVGVTKTYDGKNSAITAVASTSEGVSSTITYQWYRKLTGAGSYDAVAGATASSINVKDVADSGSYYVVATITIDGVSAQNTSSAVDVAISPIALTVKPANKKITYLAAVPSSYSLEVVSGAFASGETVSVLGSVDYATNYTAGSNIGSYDITATIVSNTNYSLTVNKGVLTVNAKSCNDSTVSVTLAQTTFSYDGTAKKPAYTVTDSQISGSDKSVPASNYSVSYSNNINSGTASVIFTFTGNYTGTVTKTFTISKGSFTPSVTIANAGSLKYGATDSYQPSLVSSPSGIGAVTYYYASATDNGDGTYTAGTYSKTKPVNAGTYAVYATVAAGEYEASTSAPFYYTIAKRNITITTGTGSWVYDGNTHRQSGYSISGDGFATSEGFKSVEVTGSIIYVGTVSNSVTATFTGATNANNYAIVYNLGQLTVTKATLTAPTTYVWNTSSSTAPATAEWVPVTKENVTVGYNIQLYKVDNSSGTAVYNAVGDAITTTAVKYDFTSIIRANGKGQYVYTIQTVPYGGDRKDCFNSSAAGNPYSSNSGSIYAVSIAVTAGSGVDSVSAEGGFLSAGSHLLITGESLAINAVAQTGYGFSSELGVWSASNTTSGITINNVGSSSTAVTAGKKGISTYEVELVAKAYDEAPVISNYHMSDRAADGSTVTLSADLSDTKGLTAWAISTSATLAGVSDSEWHSVEGEAATAVASRVITVSDVTAQASYYVYVKDNQSPTPNSAVSDVLSVYRISFDKGDTTGEVVMNPVLKVQNEDITLPLNAFTKDQYAFSNWKLSGVNTYYPNGGVFAANGTSTLVAQWTNEKFNYKLNYYYMNLDGTYNTTPDKSVSSIALYGTVINTDDSSIQKNMTGFVLDSSVGHSGSITLMQNNLELNIYYKRVLYTINYSYVKNGATVQYGTSDYYYGQTITELEKPVADGYTFSGWNYSTAVKPTTMPANNLDVTGEFEANTTVYYVNRYLQNVDCGNSYTLLNSTSCNGVQDENVYAGKDGASVPSEYADYTLIRGNDVTGFTYQGVAVTYGSPAGSTLTQQVAASATATISAVSSNAVYINFYYTRNTYTITLNVWKGDPAGAGSVIYTKPWTVAYGTQLDSSVYETYEQDKWDDSTDLTDYVLADYVNWSTGTKPTSMPAGDVTITREYVNSNEIKDYSIEVYFADVDGNYSASDMQSFTYRAALGSEITFGTGSNYTVNTQTFDMLLADKIYAKYNGEVLWTYDSSNPNTVSSIALTESGNNTIKVYYKRASVTSNVRYVYIDKNGASHTIATQQLSGTWGSTYTVDVDRFFYADSDTTGFNGTADSTYAAKNYNTSDCMCQVQYSTLTNGLLLGTTNLGAGYRSSKITKDSELTSDFTATYRGDIGNYIYVYYCEVNANDYDFYLDVKYSLANLDSASRSNGYITSKYGASTFNYEIPTAGMTSYSGTATTLPVRVANKAFFYSDTAVSVSGTQETGYLAAGYTPSYTCSTLKAGYTRITDYTDSGYEFYVGPDASGNGEYFYIAATDNRFYLGNITSYTLTSTTPKYSELTGALLTDYKANATSDTERDGVYLYNHSWGSGIVGNSNGTCIINYAYAKTYKINFCFNSQIYTTAGYRENTNADLNTAIAGCTAFDSQIPEGYEIKWYYDDALTRPVSSGDTLKMDGYKSLYGQLIRSTVFYNQCSFYESPDTVSYNGVNYDYFTSEMLADTNLVASSTVNKTVSITNGLGVSESINTTVTTYTYNGFVVAVIEKVPTLSNSTIVWNVSAITPPDGYEYDSSNSNNRNQAYIRAASTDLKAYYCCKEYELTVNQNNGTNTWLEEHNGKSTVTLDNPVYEGYVFDGWTPSDNTVNITLNSGVSTFAMPIGDMTVTAKWKPASLASPIVANHYFQRTDGSYDKTLLTSIGKAATKETVTVGSVVYTVYKDAGGAVIGASTMTGTDTDNSYTIRYFDAFDAATGSSEADLCCAVTYINRQTDGTTIYTESTVDSTGYILDEGNTYSFNHACYSLNGANTVITSDSATKTFIYMPGMTIDYYYDMPFDNEIRTAAFAADGSSDTGISTLTGSDSYYYGRTVTIAATLNPGYDIVGWYNAADVLDNYDINSSASLSSYSLKANITATPVSTALSFSAVADATRKDYVLITSIKAVGDATVSVSGKQTYDYNYSSADTSRFLSTTVNFAQGVDTTVNYVSGYQWYTKDAGGNLTAITGANSAAYNFPSGKNAGTYTYVCEATITRTDNGKTRKVMSDDFKITVNPISVPVSATSYSWIYDSTSKSPAVSYNLDSTTSASMTTYYSARELTAAEIATLEGGSGISGVTQTAPFSFSDVAVEVQIDGTTRVVPHTVYYYIVTTNSNYKTTSGKVTATVSPKTITLTPRYDNSYSREYDGTVVISGTLSDTTSNKYKLSKGSNFYTINGICSKDVDATVLDFDAAYNDKDVSDANQITLTNIKVMILDNGNTVRDYNYIFNGSDSFVMSGYISQRSLPVAWSAGVGGTYSSGSYVYTYDGEKHAPLAALDDSISTAGTVEIAEGVKVSVSGEQKNVGNYNAYAALSSDSSEFSSSNYVIQNDVQAFAIKKNAGTVSQVDLSVAGISGEAVYDGKTHTVNSSYFGLGDLLPSGYTWTIDVTYEDAAGNVVEAPKAAGTYSVIPGNLKIYDNEGINVTDNYDMTYSNGSYVIKPCELTIDLSSLVRAADNIVADDKEYDTTTSATINSSVIKLANVVDGETVGITGVTGTFDNKNAGSDKTVNLDTSSAVLTGADSSNYVFVQSTGLTTTASISKANITVTTSDGSWVYDGTAHTMHTTASITGLKGEDTLVDSDIVFTGTITEVGTVKNTISGITVRNSGDIVSDNYTYNAVEGTLEVTKASSLSITSGTKTWVYDDTVHTDKTYSIDFGSQTYTATDNGNGTFSYVLSTGDTVTITPSGIGASGVRNVSDTAASNNKFTYTVTNSSNYSSISTVYGKLSVTPAAITVKSSDTPTVSKVYDGTTAGTSFVGTDDYVFEGLQGDDTLQLSAFTATYDSADASQYDLNNNWTAGASKVTMTGLAINDGNYTLVTTTFDITAKITVATLVINVVNKSVTYGGSYSFDETSGLTYGTSGANGLVASDVGKTLAQIGITYNVTCDYDPLSTDNTKYGVGAYDITFNTTANNSNYNVITVNNGKLTVNQKVLSVTADDKTFTYGDIETYTSKISGFVRSETEAGVISGAVTYSSTCSSTTVAGTYSKAITPVTTGLTISSMGKDGTTPNYKFSVANGTVTINRKAITLTGVTASDRTYNAAKTAVLAAANPSCAQLDFGTATYSNGVLTIPVTGLNLNGTDDVNNLSYKITVTGVYASGDAGENIAVTLTGTLDTELAKRYTLNALGSANANINKAVLTVTCVNKSVVYGSAAPSYTVSYSGFVGTQTTAVLTTVPKATCNEYSGTSPFTSVGTYTGVITAAGGVDENYSFSYVPGNVTVTQAQLATPAPVWSSTAPGSISWAAIAGKGDATVTGYTATLYDQNNAVVDTQTVTGTSYDFASAIRAHGAGAYTVGVVANSSNQTNCKNSAQGKSGSVYAAKITLSKASDTYSTNGITAMTVNSASTYVMIAGESGIAVDATLANATGYSVKSWMTSSKTTTDSTVSAVVSPSSTTSPAGSFSGNVAVSSKLNSYADINLVLTLTPTSPTLSLAYSVDNPVAMDYNYPDTRTITVTPSVVSGDNVTTGGYTYSYVWHYYKGASDITITDGTTSNIGDKQGKVTANGNQLVFETGNLVGTYIYYCVVTATRTDNSASKTVDDNSKKVTLTVNRGKFLPVITISGWTWGDERKAPSYPASFTPPVELQTTNSSGVRLLEANTTYMYSTDNSNETAADDTTTVPTNAGTYYVYADVAATSWYDRQKSAPVEFTIAKTQLSTPTGLAWTTSGYTTIGDLSWNAVASTTEPNNGSLTENNGSGTDKISVSYTVRLYKKDGTAGSPDTLINTYTTTATKYDASADINKNGQGTYYFTVVANSSNTGNCDDSALETSPEITVDIVLSAVNLADSLSSTSTSVSKVYDGYPYRLNVSSETLNLTGATYAWYKNGQLISGATGSSFDVANVSDTGSYHCVISVGGTTYRTNFMSVTVTARPINVEASSQTRVYNAQPLTNAGFTVTGTAMGTSVSGVAGNQSTILNVTYKGLDGSNKTVTEAIANVSVTGSQTYAGSSDNTASGAAIMNGSTDVSGNYAISYSKGTLKVTKAALTITANSTSWVFDNTEHTDAGFSKTAPVGLQGSDKVNSITASGAITDVGTCDNVPSGAVVKSGTTDVTANYEISYVKGTLTVTQSGALTANVTSYSETYDSESHSIAVAATGAAGSAATTISYSTDKTNWITTAPEYKNVTV